MAEYTRRLLVLDTEDAEAVADAVAVVERSRWGVMPGGASNEEGALIAGICRDWLERVEMDKKRVDESPAADTAVLDAAVLDARKRYLNEMQNACALQLQTLQSMCAVEGLKRAVGRLSTS